MTLDDLKIMLQIIDACASRAAFKPEEFIVVGNIRQKIVAFIEANTITDDIQPEEAN